MINVLSVDGGGIRGVIPALVLQELEERTGRSTADLFDLIAGTSTGGIIGLGLTLPVGGGMSGPRYSAEELADLYWERGRDIFYRSLFRGAMSMLGFKDERYSNAGLRRVLAEYFGDEPIQNALTDVMVTTYDIEERSPFFLKSWRAHSEGVPMRQAAWATSSAPTYFEPAEMWVRDERRVLIDGGVFVNSPAVSAYAEAKKLYPEEEIRVVSIGTGTTDEPIAYEDAVGWGDLGWARTIIDVVLDGMVDAADYQLDYILGDRFNRFQVKLEAANDELDDASSRNLKALTQDARRMIDERSDDLTALAEVLAEPVAA